MAVQISRSQLGTIANAIQARLPTREEFKEKLSPKPKRINSYAGEKEILRKANVLVTDTRLAFIDPYDRMLKTFMFEHMISLNKNYYRTTTLNRRMCKSLLFFAFIILLITLIIDLLDNNSRGFLLVYIPALLSLTIGLLVWRDMRPKYKIEWKMRDGSTDKIATEPLFREWIMDNKKREAFMDELAQSMNEALSGKAWWPLAEHPHRRGHADDSDGTAMANRTVKTTQSNSQVSQDKMQLKLVTKSYE